MADVLRGKLRDPDIPQERKDPASWSARAQREWGDDNGTAAAAEHRSALMNCLKTVREAIDDFDPEVLVVWGDDQYENFREEVIPPFCILIYEDTTVEPFGVLHKMNVPNWWSLPDDTTFTMKGYPRFAKDLAEGLLERDVDVAYSYEKRADSLFPHAFGNTQLFLDFENAGREFPYPIVPIAVNCYGQHVIARRGGRAKFAEIQREQLDPPGPSPRRCMAFGRAVGAYLRDLPGRVVIAASASWSHAFLNDKDWHLRPDVEADRMLYKALEAGDIATWENRTTQDVVSAGQHEMLNWFCWLGAVEELGLCREWSEMVESEVFNSNKVFAVYR